MWDRVFRPALAVLGGSVVLAAGIIVLFWRLPVLRLLWQTTALTISGTRGTTIPSVIFASVLWLVTFVSKLAQSRGEAMTELKQKCQEALRDSWKLPVIATTVLILAMFGFYLASAVYNDHQAFVKKVKELQKPTSTPCPDATQSFPAREEQLASMLSFPACDLDSLIESAYDSYRRGDGRLGAITNFLVAVSDSKREAKRPIGLLDRPRVDSHSTHGMVLSPENGGYYFISGWAIDHGGLSRIILLVDGKAEPYEQIDTTKLPSAPTCEQLTSSAYGLPSPDITQQLSSYPSNIIKNSRFCFKIPQNSLPSGSHMIEVKVENRHFGFRGIFNKEVDVLK